MTEWSLFEKVITGLFVMVSSGTGFAFKQYFGRQQAQDARLDKLEDKIAENHTDIKVIENSYIKREDFEKSIRFLEDRIASKLDKQSEKIDRQQELLTKLITSITDHHINRD